jgi:hypothetical protein
VIRRLWDAFVDLLLMGKRVSDISETLHAIQAGYAHLERRVDELESDLRSIVDRLGHVFRDMF